MSNKMDLISPLEAVMVVDRVEKGDGDGLGFWGKRGETA